MHNVKNTHRIHSSFSYIYGLAFFAPKAKSVFYYLSDKAQALVHL